MRPVQVGPRVGSFTERHVRIRWNCTDLAAIQSKPEPLAMKPELRSTHAPLSSKPDTCLTMKKSPTRIGSAIPGIGYHSNYNLLRLFTFFAVILSYWEFHASADITVIDNGMSFSPDPANIVVGEAVLWQDDGSGPYQIVSDTGAWAPFNTPGAIVFSQTGTFSYHDDVGDFGTVQVSPNLPPSVTITNPATNAVFTAPASFVFAVDASDPDSDGLSDVEFYVGTNLVDDVFSSPFTTTVTNLPAGSYNLTSIAYDNAGATATNSITIYVQGLILSAPMIVAGKFKFNVSGLTVGKTNVLQSSTNLSGLTVNWVSIGTNVATASAMSFTNLVRERAFFRLLQLP